MTSHIPKQCRVMAAASAILYVLMSGPGASVVQAQSTLPKFIIQPVSVPSGVCSPGIYISLLNTDNTPGTIPLGTSVTLQLTGNSTTQFYSDPACQSKNQITSLTLTGSATPFSQTTVYAIDSVKENLSLTVAGIDATKYVSMTCSAVPQPPAPFPDTTFKNQSIQSFVTGTKNSPDGKNGPIVMLTQFTTGETVTTELLGAPSYSSPCQVAPVASFSPETIPNGKQALVTVYGTWSYDSSGHALTGAGSGTLANATIRVMSHTPSSPASYTDPNAKPVCVTGTLACSNMGVVGSHNCYCASLVNVTPTITPPAQVAVSNPGVPNTITPALTPAGYTNTAYFALPAAPQDLMIGQYENFTISTSATGDIGYTIQADILGSLTGLRQVKAKSGATNYGPLLSITNPQPAPLITAGNCSSTDSKGATVPPISVITTDGNGVLTNVLPGKSLATGATNTLSISTTSSPAQLFEDGACYFPAIGLTISNPAPAQPKGSPSLTNASAPLTVGTNQVNFYYSSPTAELFDIGANYRVNNMQQAAVTLQDVVAPIPTTILVSAPSAVTQSTGGQLTCSAGVTISLEDAFGNVSAVQGCTKTLSLSAGSSAHFFLDSGCSTTPVPGNQLSFPAGTSHLTVYVSDTSVELLKVNAIDVTNYASAACTQGNSGGQMIAASGGIHVLSLGQIAVPDPKMVPALTRNLYIRLVGTPPLQSDLLVPTSAYAQMYKLVQQGQLLQAAAVATSVDDFYNVTLRNVATSISNQLFDPLYPLNDFVTTYIGIARDDIDARQILTSNFIYAPSSYGSCTGSGATLKCVNQTSSCAPKQTVVYDESGNSYPLGSSVDLYSNGAAYQAMDTNFINLRKNLVQVPQCAYNSYDASDTPTLLVNSHLQSATGQQAPASAGLLTTRAWGIAHLYQGTNRRAIREAMNVFLCKDITALQDNTMDEGHVRRDVDRTPGGSATSYQATCRGCHAGMDALGGAYAFFDTYFPDGTNPTTPTFSDPFIRNIYNDTSGVSYANAPQDTANCNGTSSTMQKVKRNCTVFPKGYTPADDAWVNNFIANQNSTLGWDPATPLNGNGINSLGNMLANSAQFGACMAQRAFNAVCKRPPTQAEATDVNGIATDFQANHNLRRLYELTATLPQCLNNGGGN